MSALVPLDKFGNPLQPPISSPRRPKKPVSVPRYTIAEALVTFSTLYFSGKSETQTIVEIEGKSHWPK